MRHGLSKKTDKAHGSNEYNQWYDECADTGRAYTGPWKKARRAETQGTDMTIPQHTKGLNKDLWRGPTQEGDFRESKRSRPVAGTNKASFCSTKLLAIIQQDMGLSWMTR